MSARLCEKINLIQSKAFTENKNKGKETSMRNNTQAHNSYYMIHIFSLGAANTCSITPSDIFEKLNLFKNNYSE